MKWSQICTNQSEHINMQSWVRSAPNVNCYESVWPKLKIAYCIRNTYPFSCIPLAYTCVPMLVLSLYCKCYQLSRLVYAYKSLTVFAFPSHIRQNTAKGQEKENRLEENFSSNTIAQYNVYTSAYNVQLFLSCIYFLSAIYLTVKKQLTLPHGPVVQS